MASQPNPSPGSSSFHFILGPSLEAVGGCERKAIRSELIRRRCLQKKLRYQQEQRIKLDQLLKGSSNIVQDSRKCSVNENTPSPDETNALPLLDIPESPALSDSKRSTPISEPATPHLEAPSNTSSNCLSCGGNLASTDAKALLSGSYCICDTTTLGSELQVVDGPDLYPIPTRWYMPLLLDYFNKNLAFKGFPVRANSMAYQLQTEWMKHALSDAYAFHATLYAASAHLDMTRGKTSVITLCHETEMIRLVNLRLDNSRAAFDDRTLAAVISLASFAPFTQNFQSSQAHMNALLSMVNARGGLNALGLDGLLAGLTQMASIAFATVFDCDLLVELPPTAPSALLSTMIKQTSSSLTSPSAPCPTTTAMFQDMQNTIALLSMVHSGSVKPDTVDWIIHKGRLQADRKFHTAENDQALLLEPQDHINRACQLAAIIFWTVVGQAENSSQEPLVGLEGFLQDLETTVAAVDRVVWLRTAPVVYSWVCLTGAAAAWEMRRRAWFQFHQSHRGLVAGAERLVEECWGYFVWLRGLRKRRGFGGKGGSA